MFTYLCLQLWNARTLCFCFQVTFKLFFCNFPAFSCCLLAIFPMRGTYILRWNKLVYGKVNPSIHPSQTIRHLHYAPESSPSVADCHKDWLLIGCHRATNTCHFIINTCCGITATCFRLHWLFHGDKVESNEWLNAFPSFSSLSTKGKIPHAFPLDSRLCWRKPPVTHSHF